MKNELQHAEVIQLRVEGQNLVGPSGVESELLGCGTCFDFSLKLDYIFLGKSHRTSTLVSIVYLYFNFQLELKKVVYTNARRLTSTNTSIRHKHTT